MIKSDKPTLPLPFSIVATAAIDPRQKIDYSYGWIYHHPGLLIIAICLKKYN